MWKTSREQFRIEWGMLRGSTHVWNMALLVSSDGVEDGGATFVSDCLPRSDPKYRKAVERRRC